MKQTNKDNGKEITSREIDIAIEELYNMIEAYEGNYPAQLRFKCNPLQGFFSPYYF